MEVLLELHDIDDGEVDFSLSLNDDLDDLDHPLRAEIIVEGHRNFTNLSRGDAIRIRNALNTWLEQP